MSGERDIGKVDSYILFRRAVYVYVTNFLSNDGHLNFTEKEDNIGCLKVLTEANYVYS